MGYLVVWALTLTACLLTMTLIIAFTARTGRKGLGRAFFIIVFLFILIFLTGAALFFFTFLDKGSSLRWLIPYSILLAVGYILGTIVIGKRGRKIGDAEALAVKWPAAGLALLLLIVIAADYACMKAMAAFHQAEAVKIAGIAQTRFTYRFPQFIPGRENAYSLYLKVAMPAAKYPEWLSETMKPNFNPTASKVTQYLNANQNGLNQLYRAAELEHYSIEPNIILPIATQVEQYSDIRSLTKLMLAQAKLQAVNRDPRACKRSLEAMAQMAKHVSSRPILVNTLVGGLLDSYTYDGLEYSLAQIETWPKDLLSPPAAWAFDRAEYYRRAIQAEIDTVVSLLDSHLSISMPRLTSIRLRPKWLYAPMDFLYRVFLLPADVKLAQDLLQWGESKDLSRLGLIAEDERLDKAFQEKGGLWFKFVFPEFQNFADRAFNAEAEIRLCRLALAATAFKTQHGRWPKTLDELTPQYIDAIPKDPFSTQPIQMKAVEGGLDLFSVGPPEDSNLNNEPIHFYLGPEAYRKYRVEPALAAQQSKKDINKK